MCSLESALALKLRCRVGPCWQPAQFHSHISTSEPQKEGWYGMVVFQKKKLEKGALATRSAYSLLGAYRTFWEAGGVAPMGPHRQPAPLDHAACFAVQPPGPPLRPGALQQCKNQSPSRVDATLGQVAPNLHRWYPHTPVHVTHPGRCLHPRAPQQGQTALPLQPGLVNVGVAICQRSAAPHAWGLGGCQPSQTCPAVGAAARS